MSSGAVRGPRLDPFVARWLTIIVVAGAVVRIAAALDLSGLPYFLVPQADAGVFDLGARRIAAGDLLLRDQIAGMSPGYFYVLGAVYSLFGAGPWAIRALQVLLGLALVLLVFDAARRVMGERIALVLAAIAAAYGPTIFFESQLLGETVAVALHAAALDVLLVARARGGRAWMAFGAIVGAAAWLRPSALLLIVVAPLVAPRGTRVRAGLGAALAALVAIAPITARNLVASGEPVLISGHGGVNLWVGNGPGANGGFRIPPEVPGADAPGTQFQAFREVASREEGRELGIAEADRYWTRRTMEHALGHPLEWGLTMLRKLHLVWNGRELSDVYRYELLRDRSEVLRWMFRFAWLAPFAFVGLALSFRAGADERAVAWIAMVEIVSVVLVWVSARYRLAAVPALLVLAAIALDRVRVAWDARDRTTLSIASIAMIVGVGLAIPVGTRPAEASGLVELGVAWELAYERERALECYDEALAAEPSNLVALERAARAELALGEGDRARARIDLWIEGARAQGDDAGEATARALRARL